MTSFSSLGTSHLPRSSTWGGGVHLPRGYVAVGGRWTVTFVTSPSRHSSRRLGDSIPSLTTSFHRLTFSYFQANHEYCINHWVLEKILTICIMCTLKEGISMSPSIRNWL